MASRHAEIFFHDDRPTDPGKHDAERFGRKPVGTVEPLADQLAENPDLALAHRLAVPRHVGAKCVAVVGQRHEFERHCSAAGIDQELPQSAYRVLGGERLIDHPVAFIGSAPGDREQ
jgi:hypothetical protein